MAHFIIADNQDITRLGIEHILQHDAANTIDNAFSKSEIVALLKQEPASVVIMDYTNLNFTSPDELLILNERFCDAHFLIFSEDLSLDFIHKISIYNSFSLTLKSDTEAEIKWAIDSAVKGSHFICNEITNRLINEKKNEQTNTTAQLTKSEVLILKEIATGKTTKEIAADKCLSFHTVNTHRKNIFRKLNVNNVHEAIKVAIRSGLVDIAEYYI